MTAREVRPGGVEPRKAETREVEAAATKPQPAVAHTLPKAPAVTGIQWAARQAAAKGVEPAPAPAPATPEVAAAVAHGLPPPTIWPAVLALGITLLAAGIATNWLVAVGGAALFVWGLWGWVRAMLGADEETIGQAEVAATGATVGAAGATVSAGGQHG